MVNLLVGPKGSGKTPDLIDKANQNEKTEHGSVVFIKKTHRNTKEISFNIRTICMEDFPNIDTLDRFIGFMYGIYSCNTDVKQIYIDETFKIGGVNLESAKLLIDSLKTMSHEDNMDFYVSISATKDEIKNIDTSQCKVINY